MTQKYTILFDLDGTLVDTAPDLMKAHNHIMKKYGYKTKSAKEIRNLVGKGASALIGRSLWGSAKEEFGKIEDKKIKDKMVNEFINYYGNNILNESTLINGVENFLSGVIKKNFTGSVHKQTRTSSCRFVKKNRYL